MSYEVIEDLIGRDNTMQKTEFSPMGNNSRHIRPHAPIPEPFQTRTNSPQSLPGAFPFPPPPPFEPRFEHRQHHQPKMEEEISPIFTTPLSIHCIDAFSHMEDCPVCSSYMKKDIKFYWFIIIILLGIILLLSSKIYDKAR